MHTVRPTDGRTDGQTDRRKDGQVGRPAGGQAGRQSGGQTETCKGKHTDGTDRRNRLREDQTACMQTYNDMQVIYIYIGRDGSIDR